MQHDETRWRCLVACAYPCRLGDIFPLIRHREFFGPDRIRLTLRGSRRRQFVPPPDAWLHEPCAGNAGLGRAIPPSPLLDEFSSSPARTLFVSISK